MDDRSFREWIIRNTKPTEKSFVVGICATSFPFKWWDASTLREAISNYRKLCPNDPHKLGPYSSRIVYDILVRYTSAHVTSKGVDKLTGIRKAREHLKQEHKAHRKVQYEIMMQDPEKAAAWIAKKEDAKDRKALRKAKKEKIKVSDPKQVSEFPRWVFYRYLPTVTSCNPFKANFLNALSEGKLCNKEIKGNVRLALARALPAEFSTLVDDLYAQFYKEGMPSCWF